jgi:acetoin utilization protein AcuB
MRVRDLMTPTPITVPSDMPILDARALMERARVRHLLVVDAERLVGIVTDRDVRLNLPSPATSLSVWELNHLLARLTVGQVMTPRVLVTAPDRDARDAARTMLEQRIGALPVVDGGRLVGIITDTDLVRGFTQLADLAEPLAT